MIVLGYLEYTISGLAMRLNLRRNQRYLAIGLHETAFHVAEFSSTADETVVTRRGRFPIVAGQNLDGLTASADDFARFLKTNRFEAARAVVGLPARHFLLNVHELPRVDAKTTASAMWQHASMVIAPELGAVSLDFVSDEDGSDQQHVALVGMQQRTLDKLRTFCERVGLAVDCVFPTIFALARCSEHAGRANLVLCSTLGVTEIVAHVDGIPRLMRAVATGTPALLQSELRRCVARLSGMRETNRAMTLVRWGESNLEQSPQDEFDLHVVDAKRNWIAANEPLAGGDETLPLLAIVDYAARRDGRTIDVAHPKLAAPKAKRFTRPWALLAIGAAACLLIGVGVLVDLHVLQTEAIASRKTLDDLQPDVRAAKPSIQRMQFASAFTNTEPRYLACLRDLTAAVAAMDGIVLTHFDLNGGMQGGCSGEAKAQQDAVDFVDRVSATKRFARINSKLDSHSTAGQTAGSSARSSVGESAGESEKVSFHIAFLYVPKG